MRIFEQILLQTRQKFAGILGVWQEFLTQYAAKFAEKTQADAYAHKLSDSTASGGANATCIIQGFAEDVNEECLQSRQTLFVRNCPNIPAGT